MKRKERPYGITSGGEKLAYALGDLGSNFVWSFISSYLTMYYTDSVLLPTALLGTIMLVTRILDGFSDVAAGILIERTRTKMGKARPWFGISIIPLVISQLLVFNVPSSLGTSGKLIWVVITYFLLTVVFYTVNNLSYHAMLSRFSLDGEDRNKVSSLRGVFAFLAGLVLAIVTPSLLAANGGMKVQASWTTVALLYSVLCLVLEGICFFGCKEKISCFDEEAKEKKAKPDLSKGLNMLLNCKYFYISIIIFIVVYIVNGMSLAVALYYTRDVLGNEDLYSLIAIGSVFATVIGLAVSPKLIKSMGKKKALILGSILGIAGCVIGLVGARNFILVLVAKIVAGLGLAPYVAGIFTFAPDIVELLEKKSGARYEGLVTAVNSVGIKIGTGLASAFILWGLSIGKYDATLAVQPESAVVTEIILMFGVPIVMHLICILCMGSWDLEKKLKEQ